MFYAWGRWSEEVVREVVRVYTESSENWSNYVRLNFRVTVSAMPEKSPGYESATDLFAPNYAPVAPMPGASVISHFLVDLLLRLWRRIYNEGRGSIGHYVHKARTMDWLIHLLRCRSHGGNHLATAPVHRSPTLRIHTHLTLALVVGSKFFKSVFCGFLDVLGACVWFWGFGLCWC